MHDADGAQAAAEQQLGAGATKQAIDAKVDEIKTAKYSDAERLMTQDTAAKPDAAILWARLGQAQDGLKKYSDAEASFKKALDLENASKKPQPEVQGLAQSGLGEALAREGKTDDATAAFDAAAKINPPQAEFYLKNETVIFFQQGNAAAQAAAADKAIAADTESRRSEPRRRLLLEGPGTCRQRNHGARSKESQGADHRFAPGLRRGLPEVSGAGAQRPLFRGRQGHSCPGRTNDQHLL